MDVIVDELGGLTLVEVTDVSMFFTMFLGYIYSVLSILNLQLYHSYVVFVGVK